MPLMSCVVCIVCCKASQIINLEPSLHLLTPSLSPRTLRDGGADFGTYQIVLDVRGMRTAGCSSLEKSITPLYDFRPELVRRP